MSSLLLCLLLVSVVDGLQQVMSGKYSSEFDLASTAVTFASNSDVLYRLETSETYSVLTWAKFQIQPTSSLPYVFLKASGTAILTLSKEIDGSLRAQAVTLSGVTVTASLTGPVTSQWTHVAAFVCSTTLTLVVTPWQGTSTSVVQTSAEAFKSYDSVASSLVLGGTAGSMMIVKFIQGQLLDTKFDTVCATLGDIAAIVGSAVCHSQCTTGCSGPGDKSCNEYIQLFEETITKSVVLYDVFTWEASSPHLQGRTFNSGTIAVTGWYYVSSQRSDTTCLFQLSNIEGEALVIGNRVLAAFLVNDAQFSNLFVPQIDTTTAISNSPGANCSGSYSISCYGFLGDAVLSCRSGNLVNTLAWGGGPDSKIHIGNIYHGGVNGKIADMRFYYETCKSEADFNNLFTQRKTFCGENCSTCSSPLECSNCLTGFYQSSGVCYPCNSACLSCTGSGVGSCSSCISTYQIYGTSTCTSKQYIECQLSCATCSGTKYPGCDTCSGGYLWQPQNSHRCLSICPTGYTASGGVCVDGDEAVLDFTFDSISPTVQGIGTVVGLNGATTAYFPPTFEISDPLPSKKRGYYFTGTQYIQLPPLPGTSGSPLVLTSTFTFSAWIRPQGAGSVYSKKTVSDDIFTVRVNSSFKVEFVGGNPDTTFAHSSILSTDTWVFVSIQFDYNSASAQTTLTYFYDGVQHASTYSGSFIIIDDSLTAPQIIGASALLSDFYRGFIWRVKISNYVSPDPINDIVSPSCPLGPTYCLSPCPFTETPDCLPCLGTCSNGCVRTTDCSLCSDPICLLCPDFFTSDCSICMSGAFYNPPCSCSPGQFFNAIAQVCQQCAPECMECSSYIYCTNCFPLSALQGSQCVCSPGFYPLSSPGHCATCPDLCSSCLDPSNCQTCKSHAYLQNRACLCSQGYQQLHGNCVACAFGCSLCKSGCSECLPGYFLLDESCRMSCPMHYLADEITWKCEYLPSTGLTATLEALFETVFRLSFSVHLSQELKEADFSLTLVDTDSNQLSFNFQLAPLVSSREYNLTVYPDILTDAQLTLIFSPTITNSLGEPLETLELYANLAFSIPVTSGLAVSTSSTVTQASLTTSLVTGLISGSPSSFFTTFNNVQLLSYLPLSGVPLPQSVRNLLTSLNLQSFVPNPFLWDFSSMQPPAFAADYGYESCAFLANIGVMLCVGCMVLTFIIIFKSLHRCSLVKYEAELDLLVRYWIQVYLDVALAAFIQFWNIDFHSFPHGLSSFLGCFFFFLTVISPFAVSVLCYKLWSQVSSTGAEALKTWKVLFAEFKNDKGPRSGLFYAIFLFRRLTYAATLTGLTAIPKLQASVFCASSLITIGYLCRYKPYKDSLAHWHTQISELCIFLVFAVSFALTFQPGRTIVGLLSASIKAVVFISLGMSNIISLYSTFVALKKVVLLYRRVAAQVTVQKAMSKRGRSWFPNLAV